jgi:hypothetical protein
MKKKVVIERVPSSKKKVVIQGLPKADIGKRMAEKKADRMQSAWDKDIAQYPNSIAYPNQQDSVERDAQGYPVSKRPDEFSMFDWKDTRSKPSGIDNTFYSGADSYVENPKYSDSKSVENKKGLKNKKNVNWDFSKSNFGLFPLSGGKYAQRGFNYLNQIPGQIQDAVSVFKTGKPTEKKQYPVYNPYVNAYWNYAEGGYLPKYVEAGITGFMNEYPRSNDEKNLDKEPEFRVGDEGYYESMGRQKQYPIENVNPMGFDSQGNITERVQSINPEPQLQPDLKKPKDKTKILKTIQKVGAVAAPVASTVLAGYNFAKQGLSDVGSNIANRKAQQAENQLYTQSVFSDAMNVTPYEEQGYGFTGRNALAADGMQIKQIGGMGEPNVEVEGKEHIQLPNGFSQEIQGKKHSEGGIPINLPQGTKIFSEKLKVPVSFLKEAIALDPENQMLKSLKLPKTGKISYADLAKKFETKKYVDLLNSKDADAIQMTTAQLMIQQNNAKLEELFGLQEQNKISGVHGPQVQQNAQQEQQEQEAQQAQMQGEQMQGEEMEQPMMKYGGYHLPKAQAGKDVILPNGKKVTAVKVKEPGKEYKPVPNMPGYFYRTTTTTTPGTPGKAGVAPQKITKFMTDEQWKEYLKKETPEQKKRRLQREQGIPAIPPTPDVVKEDEDYVYIEPEQKQETPTPQVNQTYEVPGLNLGIALPNVYERMPLNYYKLEPEYIDPRYLDIQPQLNRIGRGQRAIESTLGSRGSSDMANLLQAQANRAADEQEAYGQKYNYDRAQDAAAQQFNAQAKMNVNQYNQGSWFQQLEDPIRRRESLIGTQQMMDDQAAIENARKMQAFYGNQNYIDQTFNPYKDITGEDLASIFPVYNQAYQKGLEVGKKAKKKETETTQIDKYGGKVKKKIKIKPKLKNSYF